LRQRFDDGVHAFDEKLRQRAERSTFQGDAGLMPHIGEFNREQVLLLVLPNR